MSQIIRGAKPEGAPGSPVQWRSSGRAVHGLATTSGERGVMWPDSARGRVSLRRTASWSRLESPGPALAVGERELGWSTQEGTESWLREA